MPRKRLLKNIKTSLLGILSFVLIVGLYSFYNIGTIHAEVSDSYKKAVLGTDSLSILASEDESYAKDGSEYTDNMLHFKRGETVSYIKFDLTNLDSNKTILKATVRLLPTENFDKETNKIYAFMLDESWNSKKQDVQEIIKLLGTYDGEKFNPVGAISGPLPPISGNELVNEFLNTAHGEGYIYKDGNTTLVDITDIVSEQISNGNYGVLLVTDAVDKDYTFWSSENGEKEPTLSVEYKEDSSDSDGIDNGDANDDTDNTGDEDSDNIDDSGDDDGIEEDLSGDLKPVHVVCEKGEKTFRGNDTYISGSSNDKNFSDKEELMVGANVDKPLFYWDLAEIPRNAIIDSATFTFNVKNSGDVDNVYRFMGVSKNWHDSIKDVTWIDVNSSEKWEVPGANGDNDVNGIASVLNDVNNTGKYEADLRFLTIDWTSNPEDNNGMILEAKGNGTDGSQIIYSYDSKEDLRPNFTIKYRVCAVADETTGDNAEPCDFGTIAKGWQVYPKFTDANVSYRHYEAGNGFQKIESERQGSGIYQDILLAENKYYEVRFDADIESGGVQVILKDSLSNQSKIFEPNKSDYLETTDDFVPDELYVLTTKSKTVATVKSVSVNEMSDDEIATLNDDDENDDENSDGNDDGIGGNDTNNGGIEESLCGNGVIDEGELCDDGNLSNSDGCSSLCEVEKGYTCDNSVSPSACELTEAGDVAVVCTKVADVSKEECVVLAKLFDETNGKEWKDNTGWVADTSVCNWYGIECSDDKKHVVNLDLRENNLIGKIPVGLSVLSGLQALNLSGNELSGKVPNDLEKLENLQVLDLSDNKLSGDVEMFSTLTGLKKLNISMNEFEGEFASEFADMTNLEYLEIYQNNIRGEIPEKIGNLSELKMLSIANNAIEGNIPQSISNLKKLKVFHAQKNKLSCDIPEDVTALESLAKGQFDITNNQLNINEEDMSSDLVEWLDTYAGGNWKDQEKFDGECK